jgi:hypothetical protein
MLAIISEVISAASRWLLSRLFQSRSLYSHFRPESDIPAFQLYFRFAAKRVIYVQIYNCSYGLVFVAGKYVQGTPTHAFSSIDIFFVLHLMHKIVFS